MFDNSKPTSKLTTVLCLLIENGFKRLIKPLVDQASTYLYQTILLLGQDILLNYILVSQPSKTTGLAGTWFCALYPFRTVFLIYYVLELICQNHLLC